MIEQIQSLPDLPDSPYKSMGAHFKLEIHTYHTDGGIFFWSEQMYIITVKQAGREFHYTQGQFKIPIIRSSLVGNPATFGTILVYAVLLALQDSLIY